MNFRALTLKYLGWCPGVEAAARFIPDRDIPPTRIVMMVALVASVSLSSFFVAHRAFTIIGFPPSSIARVGNDNPKLAVVDDQLYIAVEVETTAGGSWADFYRSQIYLAELSLDGKLEKEIKVLDLGEAFLKSMDLLVTEDGQWRLAYTYKKMFIHNSTEIHSDLYVIHSDDGRRWEEPIVIAESVGRFTGPSMTEEERRKVRVFDNPSLTEMENGEVFLSFNVNYNKSCYSTFEPEAGWSLPIEIPMLAEEQSSFLDRDRQIAVVGVDVDPHSPKAIIVEGLLLTTMRENGSWTKPRYLSYLEAPFRGHRPKMAYSRMYDDYFLIIQDPEHPNVQVVQIVFTPDLENWGKTVSFKDVWEGSLAELPDGTLVLVSMRYYYDDFDRILSSDLYISTSIDGVNWTTPRRAEQIRDEEALKTAVTRQRSVASAFTSVAVSSFIILFIYLKPKMRRKSYSDS